MSCVICGASQSERCHIKGRGAGGSDSELNIVFMCRRHHQEQHMIGINRFAMKYPFYKKALEDKGWKYDPVILKWTHPNERKLIGHLT